MLKSYILFWIFSINQGSNMNMFQVIILIRELVLFYGYLFLKLKEPIFARSVWVLASYPVLSYACYN